MEDAGVGIAISTACPNRHERIQRVEFETPGSKEEPAGGGQQRRNGSFGLSAGERVATEHERFEHHAEERHGQRHDEVSQRHGRGPRPEVMEPETRRDDDVVVQTKHGRDSEADESDREHQPHQPQTYGRQHGRVLASDIGRSEVPSRSHHPSWYGRVTSMTARFAQELSLVTSLIDRY